MYTIFIKISKFGYKCINYISLILVKLTSDKLLCKKGYFTYIADLLEFTCLLLFSLKQIC